MGWKEILRPIRDGLRDLVPAKPEDPEEAKRRVKQQREDALKGFAYFDTFDQVVRWRPGDADATQKANTPLLRRPPATVETKSARIMLCHDYRGNYQDYESNHGTTIGKDVYTCNYMQYVDTFIYFSHKLVCVPPPTWTTSLHRNGVKVLGTFLIERQTRDKDRMLHEDHPGEFPVARQLAAIAGCFGFDGWLINIEGAFSKAAWDLDRLLRFISHLKSALSEQGIVIWYDALTTQNEVHYQNSLTSLNLPFAKAADGLFTNYEWSIDKAHDAKILAKQSNISLESIYFGIDVWAQDTQHGHHRRVTYPQNGGGGTNTGVAVARLAETGFSAGIFGPAWCYEHFEDNARQVEKAMWDGERLPDDIECSCGNARPHHTVDYMQYPITQHARKYAVGSQKFFYTDFSQSVRSGHTQLVSQSILPHLRTTVRPNILEAMRGELNDDPPCFAVWLHDAQSSTNEQESPGKSPPSQLRRLHLFDLNMPVNGSVQMRIDYDYCTQVNQQVHLSLEFHSGGRTGRKEVVLCSSQQKITFRFIDKLLRWALIGYTASETSRKQEDREVRLTGIGLAYRGKGASTKVELLRIFKLCIQPTRQWHLSWLIDSIRLRHKGVGVTEHYRLTWEYHVVDSVGVQEKLQQLKTSGLPYSDTTGPFAHFTIDIDGLEMGKAYSTEYVLPGHVVDIIRKSDKGVEINVTGFSFDGSMLDSGKTCVRLKDEDWELV